MKTQTTQTAFSLIELMTAVAILGVALALALPNIQYMLTSNAIVTKTNELVSAFNYARSEAITRFKPLVVSQNDTWSTGWKLQVVGDSKALRLLTYDDNIAITVTPEQGSITFDRKGRLMQTSIFTICVKDAQDGDPPGKEVTLYPMGRVAVTNSNFECQ